MLFNSFEFLFVFLPLTSAIFLWMRHRQWHAQALRFLVFASLIFYAWWNPRNLPILLVSILANYGASLALLHFRARKVPEAWGRGLLVLGIIANLLALGWFKYAGFVAQNVNALAGTLLPVPFIQLPIGISFFTFQQIAYLVDVHKGKQEREPFLSYALFVTFFPHLIAGPITHHREMMPQFRPEGCRPVGFELAGWALTYFVIGLFKKVVLADTAAIYANPVFEAVDSGRSISLVEGWCGTLAFTFQLYFDFSGYSDMAIGLAAMFGIILPLNFNSPYKSPNIIEFWRRWHMTLSRFLREYVYIPLGGSRRGEVRQYANLLLTMLIGGLWHGANWTFVVWGALHGGYLTINHLWWSWRNRRGTPAPTSLVGRLAATGLTLLAVIVGWVFFRAKTLGGALQMLQVMFGSAGLALPPEYRPALNRLGGLGEHFHAAGVQFHILPHFAGMTEILWLAALAFIACVLPNTAELMNYGRRLDPAAPPSSTRLQFQPCRPVAVAAAGLFVITLLTMQSIQKMEFLYYDF